MIRQYKRLPADNPSGALKEQGYSYAGFWDMRYVSNVDHVTERCYFWVKRDRVGSLVDALRDEHWHGRIVKLPYGVNDLVVVEEREELLRQEEF